MAKKRKVARKTKPAAKRSARRTRAAGGRESGLRLKAINPSLTVNDLDRSIAWYRDVLGCQVGDLWRDGDVVIGAELNAGDVMFMVTQDDWKLGRDRVKGAGFRMFCSTSQDVDQLAAGIKARGGTLDREPTDEWGMRTFAITDPDGFKITIGRIPRR